MKTISIAKDFAIFLGGTTRNDGEFSGQAFREDFLLPALIEAVATEESVIVDLFGTLGLPSNWLRGAFYGLENVFGERVFETLRLQAPNQDMFEELIFGYMRVAKPESNDRWADR